MMAVGARGGGAGPHRLPPRWTLLASAAVALSVVASMVGGAGAVFPSPTPTSSISTTSSASFTPSATKTISFTKSASFSASISTTPSVTASVSRSFVARVARTVAASAAPVECNGKGIRVLQNGYPVCQCFEGWGAPSDVATYKASDCSLRVCPSDYGWVNVASSPTVGRVLTECSGAGVCDRTLGACKCYDGFTGSACQRMDCPFKCSNHGKCVSLSQMAREDNSLPLFVVNPANNGLYGDIKSQPAWDADRIYSCVCDSSWPVGLDAGEYQMGEWFGPDCSLRRCPSGDNAATWGYNEENCEGKSKNGAAAGTGAAGNLCHVECSNSGICDYATGQCKCFKGFYGTNCGMMSEAAGAAWYTVRATGG